MELKRLNKGAPTPRLTPLRFIFSSSIALSFYMRRIHSLMRVFFLSLFLFIFLTFLSFFRGSPFIDIDYSNIQWHTQNRTAFLLIRRVEGETMMASNIICFERSYQTSIVWSCEYRSFSEAIFVDIGHDQIDICVFICVMQFEHLNRSWKSMIIQNYSEEFLWF